MKRLCFVAIALASLVPCVTNAYYPGPPYSVYYLDQKRATFQVMGEALDYAKVLANQWMAKNPTDTANCRYSIKTYIESDIYTDVRVESPIADDFRCWGEVWTIGSALLSYPKEDNIGKEKCKAGSDCGNPINTAFKNKFQEEIDIAEGYGFTRYYNSELPVRTEVLGKNWTHTYSRRIDSVFDPVNGRANASLLRSDGGSTIFQLKSGVWKSDFNVGWSLEHATDSSGKVTGWIAKRLGGDEEEIYDSSGRLIEISNFEKKYKVAYLTGVEDAAHNERRIAEVTDMHGRSLKFSYSANGNLKSLTSSGGATYVYGYDNENRLISITYPDGSIRQYQYITYTNARGTFTLLSGILDEDGKQFATYGYSGVKPISTEHAGAEKFVVEYPGGDTSKITTPTGAIENRAFGLVNGIYRASKIETSCEGCQTTSVTYTHDVNGNPDVTSKSTGEEVDFDYNDRGLVVEQKERNGGVVIRRTSTDWHPQFALPTSRTIWNMGGFAVQENAWTYNARGQLLSQTQRDPVRNESRTTTYSYCEQADINVGSCPLLGLVKSVDFSRTDISDVLAFQYYPTDAATCSISQTACEYRKGDLWKVTNAAGQTTEYLGYDGVGRVLSQKSAQGVVTDYTYTPRGWLSVVKVRGADNTSESDDEVTQIDYWKTGLTKKITQPDGSSTSYSYDAAHRLTDVVDGTGNSIHYELNGAGQVVRQDTKDSGGTLTRTLSNVYNKLGLLSASKDAYNKAVVYTYDANRRPKTATDALGRVSERDYDPLGRLARDLRDSGAIGAETKLEHDTLDHLTKVTDPKGLETKYGYNAFGDLLTQESPDTGLTSFAYDSSGNIASQSDANGVTKSFTYDAFNRVTKISFPSSGFDIAYSYDMAGASCAPNESFNIGLLGSVRDASGVTTYCHDRFGNLTKKEHVTDAKSFILRYEHGKDRSIKKITYPDGTVVDYVRDAAGRVAEVGVTQIGNARRVLLNQITYAPFGPPTGWTFGNGRSLAYAFDLNYQSSSIVDPAPGGLSVRYSYDDVGNLKQIETADQASVLARYGYDRLNRLIDTMDGPTGQVIDHYDYDPTGNRSGYTNAAGETSYSYDVTNHRVATIGGVPRAYDDAGNTLSVGGNAKEFVYGEDNRLSQVKSAGAVVVSYVYNEKGERVRKSSASGDVYSMYDEEGRLIGLYDHGGAPIQQFIWFGSMPVGLLDGHGVNQSLMYVEADQLGTPRVIIEPARDVAVWRWDLKGEAFGNSAPIQDPDADGRSLVVNLRYPGQLYDSDSGLLYNYQRDYDSTAGRYVQSDPLGLLAGVSTYGYVGGSPLMWSDPFGLLKWKLNDVQWNNTWGPGQHSETYPGDGQASFKPNSMGRTTIDWTISPACMCAEDNYNLQEFEIEFTPIVLMRPRYDSFEAKSSTRRGELQHVRDIVNWINSARAGAQQLENSLKAAVFPDDGQCKDNARSKMQSYLEEGADRAVEASRQYWDVSGRHNYIDRSR